MTLREVKRALRKGIRYLPGQGRIVVDAYRQAVLMKRKATAKLRLAREPNLPPADAIYWIDPARITLVTNYERVRGQPPKDRVFNNVSDKGTIVAGAWDVSTYRFAELDVVQAIRQRMEQNTDWPRTGLHARLSKELAERGSTGWGIHSPAELDAHFQRIDQLIESMRTRGYQLNHTVSLPNEDKGVNGNPEQASEITVNISREGHYLFQDGRHRLAIAQALGLKLVPVKVLVRHRQWMEFRQFMRELAGEGGASSHSHVLYQSPVHPDLQDIPAAHSCEDRFEAIKDRVARGPGTLLDIGANLGYFDHKFEDLGYSCVAVEYLSQVAEAADRIRIAEGKNFTVVSQDLFIAFESAPLKGKHFDVVLALNIFHHFIKQKVIYDRFVTWLGQLQADSMIFEPHSHTEVQMKGAYANFDEQGFVNFIIEHSMLNHFEMLHRCSDGRPIYRLWR